MDNVKIRMTITLPGRVMLDTTDKDNYTFKKTVLPNKNGKDDVIYIKERKCIPAQQVIQMSKEAYNFFIQPECPYWWHNKATWRNMTSKERLKAHLHRTMEQFGGTDYTYQILDD